MKLLTQRALMHLSALLFTSLLTQAAVAANLVVTVDGVRDNVGQLKLMLFDRAEGFRKEDKARQVLVLPATTGVMAATFSSLPAGDYAIIVYHDENDNGKLDLRLGMFPKEGYGLSNNLKPLGPPAYQDALLNVPEAGMKTTIQLTY